MEKKHSEELRALYRSPNILRVIRSRKMRWGDPMETDRQVGAPTCRWEDNIGVYLQEVE
jgi:hypothetical protein